MVNALGLWTRSIADTKEKVQNALVFFTEGRALTWANLQNETYREIERVTAYTQQYHH
jgi:hypothetical protein